MATQSKRERCSHTCGECGKVETGSWMGGINQQLADRGLCFGCNHWFGYHERREDPRAVRIDGTHYWIGEEQQTGSRWGRGFGGARWRIRFHDGREVVSTNLWCQGRIAQRWRERLPDNATFIREGSA